MQSKKQLAAVLIAAWTMLCAASGAAAADPAVNAVVVTVQRGDVHQVLSLSGRLTYQDTTSLYADTGGVVTQIAASPGQRLGAGDVLLRLQTADGRPQAIRVPDDCTVRQINAAAGESLQHGEQAAVVSSNRQRLACSMDVADAVDVHPGMWAWLHADGAQLGFGLVESMVQSDDGAMLLHIAPEQHIEGEIGAEISVEIYIAGSDDVHVLPLAAITPRETVWWVHDQICTEIPARVILTDEKQAWVELPEGIQVAIGEFTNGQRINALNPGAGCPPIDSQSGNSSS